MVSYPQCVNKKMHSFLKSSAMMYRLHVTSLSLSSGPKWDSPQCVRPPGSAGPLHWPPSGTLQNEEQSHGQSVWWGNDCGCLVDSHRMFCVCHVTIRLWVWGSHFEHWYCLLFVVTYWKFPCFLKWVSNQQKLWKWCLTKKIKRERERQRLTIGKQFVFLIWHEITWRLTCALLLLSLSLLPQRLLSTQLLLTPWLPAFMARRRMSAKALEMLHLDRALRDLGVNQLSDSEVDEVRYGGSRVSSILRGFYNG